MKALEFGPSRGGECPKQVFNLHGSWLTNAPALAQSRWQRARESATAWLKVERVSGSYHLIAGHCVLEHFHGYDDMRYYNIQRRD